MPGYVLCKMVHGLVEAASYTGNLDCALILLRRTNWNDPGYAGHPRDVYRFLQERS